MWNQSNAQNTSTPATKPPLTNGPAAAMSESPLVRTSLAASASAEQAATIGKSLVVKGEVTGSESLYIDGKVEGTINLPGNRVTVGRNGQVAANITAREIVVQGRIVGNVTASDRLDVRSEGSLTGDVPPQEPVRCRCAAGPPAAAASHRPPRGPFAYRPALKPAPESPGVRGLR